MPVIELPSLCELRYYGYVRPDTTQLWSLRTPSLQYLEIMHHKRVVHPVHGQINRHWPGNNRTSISTDYSTSLNNSAKDFPKGIQVSDSLLHVIHQSFAVQELRLYLGDPNRQDNIDFELTTFPALKRLYCSMFYLQRIDVPQLEELHLLWSSRREIEMFEIYPQETKAQSLLNNLMVLDLYSHAKDEFHKISSFRAMGVDKWTPHLTSLRMIVFPRFWGCINKFVDALSRDPHICPALTTITSLTSPASWVSLCDCLEIRNHLSMRDRSVQAIHTLHFPSAVHVNITGPLQDALSGEFASPFVAIPLQPWTLHEILPEGVRREPPPETACFGCYRSGNTFKCEGGKIWDKADCPLHLGALSNQTFAINAYRRDISGYLEWRGQGDRELLR